MKCTLGILAAAMLLPAPVAPAAPAGDLVFAGFCLPLTSRFTKCIDGKIAECIRQRGFNCKNRQSCTPTKESCDPQALGR